VLDSRKHIGRLKSRHSLRDRDALTRRLSFPCRMKTDGACLYVSTLVGFRWMKASSKQWFAGRTSSSTRRIGAGQDRAVERASFSSANDKSIPARLHHRRPVRRSETVRQFRALPNVEEPRESMGRSCSTRLQTRNSRTTNNQGIFPLSLKLGGNGWKGAGIAAYPLFEFARPRVGRHTLTNQLGMINRLASSDKSARHTPNSAVRRSLCSKYLHG
jgi:hypothetical protein